jgi:predicted O-linked N-acetylglucosamine transferase (SPINDLY family)
LVATIADLGARNVAPLIATTVASTGEIRRWLDELKRALPVTGDVPNITTMASMWEGAVRAHQGGELAAASEQYARVLALQPGHAPAHYLLGITLRERGDHAGAIAQFTAAVAAAPGFVDARVALARALQVTGDPRAAADVCVEGFPATVNQLPLHRALGLALLAVRDGPGAAEAFAIALALDSADGETHYNHGVALQMQHKSVDAARAYRRALALQPDLTAASFNLGVLFQEQGATAAAIAAYEDVLAREPENAAAYKNLGEVLQATGRTASLFANFDRFEVHCPEALALAVQALEVLQHRGEFARLDRYLDGLRARKFRAETETELCDNLEQLLYLLLFFDVEPTIVYRYAQLYDAAARHVYGAPLAVPVARRPGRVRLGYLSADLRNHVMGKMMWQAVQHHDRSRFSLHFYALSGERDEWTGRFEGIADRFDVLADLDEREAAARIAADDLDLLVDLSTHTRGAKPGILALKPARVLLTHIASAGTVGIATVDFKLTDRYADIPESQAFQSETLLPMDGCVYPYRHVAAAKAHPFHRSALGIAADAILIGAFVTPLKLSRRCLGLWREILERIPRARIAFSPADARFRDSYVRLATAAGIAPDRLYFLPQGRDDAEQQARYELIDFVLDPMPFGGVNGTLEALDMGTPVVTLLGGRHGERTSYSILANLGVTATVARTEREYVEIAVRLAADAAFMRDLRGAILAGLARSPLTDQAAHARALEHAYLSALAARAPEVLRSAGIGELNGR